MHDLKFASTAQIYVNDQGNETYLKRVLLVFIMCLITATREVAWREQCIFHLK